MRTAALLLLMSATLAAQSPEALYKERKFDEADAAAKAALASNKNDHSAMFVLGKIAENNDKHDDAIDWFEKCIKLDGNNAQYHLWLGDAVGSVAQNASVFRQPFLARRVKSEFEKAVALDPTLIDARKGLVDFYSMAPGVMGGSNDKAKEQVAEITKLNALRGHQIGAQLAERLKDYPAAEAELKAAIAAAPDSIKTNQYFPLGSFYRRRSQWDQSFAVYEQVMKTKPDEIVAHLAWGVTAAQSGKNIERGEVEIKQYLAVATVEKSGINNMSAAHYNLGTIYEKTARKDLAKTEYVEAVKVNPQNTNAKKALSALK